MKKYFILLFISAPFLMGPTDWPQDGYPPDQKPSLEIIRKNYKEIDEKMDSFPFYKIAQVEFEESPGLPRSLPQLKETTSFQRAVISGALSDTKQLSDRAISVLKETIEGTDQDALVYSISHDKKMIFNLLIRKYKRLNYVDQKHEKLFEAAIKLCDVDKSKCAYYVDELLDHKFNPISIATQRDKLPQGTKQRIENIISVNLDPHYGGPLIKLVRECDINGIETFLKNKLAFVDWPTDVMVEHKPVQWTPLCEASISTHVKASCDRFKVVKTLLEFGANPNCFEFDPYMSLFEWDKSTPWKAEFLKNWNLYFHYGASPFIPHLGSSLLDSFLNMDSYAGEALRGIESKYPNVVQEYAYRNTISTLFEIKFDFNFFGAKVAQDGGNHAVQMAKLLSTFLDDFSSYPLPNQFSKERSILANQVIMDPLKKSIRFFKSIADAVDPKDLPVEIYENSQNFPVMIPIIWEEHALSVLIYKNLFVKLNKGSRFDEIAPGARFYEFPSSPELISHLLPVLGYKGNLGLEIRQAARIFDIELNSKMHLKDLLRPRIERAQCIGNCAWESGASFAFQACLAVLLTENYQNKGTEELVNTLAYDEAKNFTESFKHFAQYNLIRKYINHAVSTLGNNRCLPDTEILTRILKKEVDKASSSFLASHGGANYFDEKIIDAILTSGLPLKSFRSTFSEAGPNRHDLFYLFKRTGLLNPSDVFMPQNAIAYALMKNMIYGIYDPPPRPGLTRYEWGRCYY